MVKEVKSVSNQIRVKEPKLGGRLPDAGPLFLLGLTNILRCGKIFTMLDLKICPNCKQDSFYIYDQSKAVCLSCGYLLPNEPTLICSPTDVVVELLNGNYEYWRWGLAYWLPLYFPKHVVKFAILQYKMTGSIDHLRFYIGIRPPYIREMYVNGELAWWKDYPDLRFGRPDV